MTQTRPTLNTERLVLRPFEPSDAPDVQRLAGNRAIADTTLNIPHPYEDGMAEAWISKHQELFEGPGETVFAITLRESGELIGAIGLRGPEDPHRRAELGYWVAKDFWNKGYCTEAARAVVEYGFRTVKLNRIYAHYMSRNSGSGRVMEKIGMRHEGSHPQHFLKWDRFEDIEFYGILAVDWEKQNDGINQGD